MLLETSVWEQLMISEEVQRWCGAELEEGALVTVTAAPPDARVWRGQLIDIDGQIGVADLLDPEDLPDPVSLSIGGPQGKLVMTVGIVARDATTVTCGLPTSIHVEQRRASFRVPVGVRGDLHTADGETSRALVLNLSHGGCAVFTDARLEAATQVGLVLELDGEHLELTALARHAAAEEEGWINGLEFYSLSRRDETTLARFIATRQRRTLLRVSVTRLLTYSRPGIATPPVLTTCTDVAPGGVRFKVRDHVVLGETLEISMTLESARHRALGTVLSLERGGRETLAAVSLELTDSKDDVAFANALRELVLERQQRED
jgi:c-di-GMP-binding flagellar brake protein YcgR